MPNIFTGIKVIDFTKVFSGPFAARLLADYGAEVLKIENEASPDDSREFPPLKNGWSGYYEILNRNKYGLSLDLKNPKDLNKLYNLCKDADVFIENLTPSTKFKLKIDYETIAKINPKIIYASLSGLGQNKDKKYYDVIAQAESGLMSLSGSPSTPMKIGPAVVDAFSGLNLAFGIASALYFRQKNNLGQYVEVSMLGSAMNLLESNLIDYSLTKQNPKRTGNIDNLISPFGAYRAKDGYIVVAVGNNQLWSKFLGFLKENIEIKNEMDFSTNSLRLENNTKLSKIIKSVFKKYRVKNLVTLLTAIDIPCSKVNSMADVYADEQNYKNDFLVKFQHSILGECVVPGRSIKFSQANPKPIIQAPHVGQHNAQYGYQIRKLVESDLSNLTKLLDNCFKIKNKDKNALIKWKFHHPLRQGQAITYVALDSAKNLVAQYSNLPLQVCWQNSIYNSLLCADMAVDPSHRGMGLITQLSQKVYADVQKKKFDFTIGFSNDSGIKVDQNSSGYGYQIVGKFANYYKLLVYRKNIKSRLVKITNFKKMVFNDQTSEYFKIAKSTEYLNWRYLEKPNNLYNVYKINIHGIDVGYSILKFDGSKCYVLDLILDNQGEDNLNEVQQCLENEAIDNGSRIIIYHVLDNNYWQNHLNKYQYFKKTNNKNNYYLTIKFHRELSEKDLLLDKDHWLLMGGDIL